MSEGVRVSGEGIIYECVQCGMKINMEQLSITPEIKCPNCGYRVVRKLRPPIVKKIKTT
jgi:DNA-directed RNA polymerase subunit P